MRIEGGKVAVEMPRSSSRKGRRRKKEAGAPPPAVQRLFETCREVFFGCAAGVVPSPEDVGQLKAVLDDMKPADVGLAQTLPYFLKDNAKGAPPVAYLHLYECDKFSIGIFCLPPSAVIPLHNHPGMTVFSKILFGSMHIKSYDWVDVPQNSVETETTSHSCEIPPKVKLAKLKKNSVFSAPCETSVLYPMAGGNLHCFTAITSCAVLDVLGPPYSDAEGRHCTYYKDFPYSSFSVDKISMAGEEGEHAWLEEIDKPDDFVVVGAKYFGPKIVVQ
ncbi:plant cysteine oxidase 2-like [Dioscorea cayenensis subsp. rotundata]|uniref:cysteine dioxygenase n=1 Tax=Dioscorea cayennensis subsp. rotundata TaxID=55577 RepID=A0AB40BC59_DIOCR|nr:plant cysteine oxidase 2-like [Dioscorea cayenensis subsp. rotundata]